MSWVMLIVGRSRRAWYAFCDEAMIRYWPYDRWPGGWPDLIRKKRADAQD
jgi:hypothetical protein